MIEAIRLLRSICVGKLLWVAFRVAPKAEKATVVRAIFEYANAIADDPETVAVMDRHPEMKERLARARQA